MTQRKLSEQDAKLLGDEADMIQGCFDWISADEGVHFWSRVVKLLKDKAANRTSDGKPYVEPEPANNRKAYTTEELIKLHELASRMDTDLSFGEKQQREAITEAAKRFGRTYKAIAQKIRTIRAE